jgi:hypothetical protein
VFRTSRFKLEEQYHPGRQARYTPPVLMLPRHGHLVRWAFSPGWLPCSSAPTLNPSPLPACESGGASPASDCAPRSALRSCSIHPTERRRAPSISAPVGHERSQARCHSISKETHSHLVWITLYCAAVRKRLAFALDRPMPFWFGQPQLPRYVLYPKGLRRSGM